MSNSQQAARLQWTSNLTVCLRGCPLPGLPKLSISPPFGPARLCTATLPTTTSGKCSSLENLIQSVLTRYLPTHTHTHTLTHIYFLSQTRMSPGEREMMVSDWSSRVGCGRRPTHVLLYAATALRQTVCQNAANPARGPASKPS